MWSVHLIARGFILPLFFILVEGETKQVPSPPKISKNPLHEQLFQMADPNTPVTRPVILECEALGTDIKYSWKKNGDPFVWSANDERLSMQPGRGTLVITIPKDIDEGLYQCFAENMYGIAVSNAVYLRRAELNSFPGDSTPIEKMVNEGQPWTLNCTPPTGLPPPNIFWVIQNSQGGIDSINNSRITADPEGNLHFSNTTLSDGMKDRLYACSAHSLYRQEYKLGNFVKLKVLKSGSTSPNKVAPRRQYTSPVDVLAMRGKKIQLSCIYGGTPLPEVKWSKKNGELPAGRFSIINFGKTLELQDIQYEDQGPYDCLVTNGVGSPQTHAMKITVQSEPYWISEPGDVNKAEEESVTFNCTADGVPEPRIQWFVNGTAIEKVAFNPRRTVTANTITIVNLKKEIDTDVYQCNASNVHGYVFVNAYVNVLALPPEIVKPPENLTEAVQGSNITLFCHVFGAPTPSVIWTKDSHPLTGGRFKKLDNSDLQIQNAQFTDRGEYICEASNKFGNKVARGHLDIKERTEIVTSPEDLEVRAGDTAVFRCNAVMDSSLDLTIKWQRENTFIDYEADPRLYPSNDNSLTVTSLQELDSGKYTCVAQTRLDNATATATLIVQDVPNAPGVITVECRPQNAMVKWRSMGDNRAPVINYIIQHNTSFEKDSWLDLTNKVPPTETAFQVSLSPWVNYTFRVIARNKIGPSLASSISDMCSTPSDLPFKNPDNVRGRGTTPTNLVISWTPMPQIEHNAPGFYYLVEYKRYDSPDQGHTVRITDWRNTTLVVENQETYKPYDIKVWAYNSVGQANVSPVTTRGYSGEDVPSQAPNNFQITKIMGPKSARFNWEAVSPETLNGDFKGYKIQTWVSPERPDDNIREMVVGPNETSAVADIFRPHSENSVRIVAFNGQYDGPSSAVKTFTTPEGVPGPVKFFNAYPLGANALYLTWVAPDEPNGILQGYNITYRKVVGTDLQTVERREGVILANRVSAKLYGLEADTNYRVTIRGFNKEEGEENYAEARTDIAFKQSDLLTLTPLGKPQFEVFDINENDLRVRWIPALEKERGRPGNYFHVEYKKQGETRWERNHGDLNEDFTTVKNLEPGTTYMMRIISMDSGDRETPSDEKEILTRGQQSRDNTDSISSAGWFVGMMCAIAFLLLVLIIVCVIKRNRGGKYSVHEKEAAQGRDLEKADDGSFNEYSKPVDDGPGGKGSQTSLTSSVKGPESETDSMAEYGDGETAKFTEDGSFIGQYGAAKKKKEPDVEPDTTSPSALSTFV